MKKIIIALSFFVALSLAGILYGTQGQHDEGETVSVEETHSVQFPNQMPDVVMDPMVGFPVY